MAIMSMIIIVVFLFAAIGLVILQVMLSKAESKWPGLILPCVSFIFSLVVVFGLMMFSTSRSSSVNTVDHHGNVVTTIVDETTIPSGARESTAITMGMNFIYINIPTVIGLCIYGVCRAGKNDKNKKDLEKMKLQDL